MALSDFIDEAGQRRVAQAITRAEAHTTGEICVHVTPHGHHSDILVDAEHAFNRLQLFRTRERNAVLVFVAYADRRLAIIGDKGINDVVPAGFWDDTVAQLIVHLKNGNATDGICNAVATIGEKLARFFPATRNDINELSNEVTYED